MAVYIDGVLDAAGVGPTGAKTAPPALRIGSLQTALGYYQGAIDEVRIYAATLPAGEIHAQYAAWPRLAPVADQVTPRGEPVELAVTAAPAAGVTFAASGLPAGLTLDSASGVIAGAPEAAGVYDVVLRAGDGSGPADVRTFGWCVQDAASTLSPQAWYPLETDARDISRYSRDGVLVGDPVFPSRGARFDGIDDAIEIPRPVSGDFSITFFVSCGSGPGGPSSQWWSGAGLVDGEVGGANHDFGVSLTGNVVAFGVGAPGGDTTIHSTTAVADRQWHHVAVTRSASTGAMAIYIDGRLDATGSGPTGTKTAPPNLRLGSLQTGINFLAGGLAEVMIFHRVLSEEDIFVHHLVLPADLGYAIRAWDPASGALTWTADPGEIYQLEWAPAPGHPFAPTGGPVPAGAGYSAGGTAAGDEGAAGLYRVRKL